MIVGVILIKIIHFRVYRYLVSDFMTSMPKIDSPTQQLMLLKTDRKVIDQKLPIASEAENQSATVLNVENLHDTEQEKSEDNNQLRPELVEMLERQALGLDENRPDAIAKRQKKNQHIMINLQ